MKLTLQGGLFHISLMIFMSNCNWTFGDCGIRPEVSRIRRLAGGQDAALREFPWQARLRSFGQRTYSGVLIAHHWVLTAASCFEGNYSPSNWIVVLNDLSSTTVDPGEVTLYVSDIYLYGGYNRGNTHGNLALVKLKSTFDDNPRPTDISIEDDERHAVCIGNGTEDLKTECFISGWGSTSLDDIPSPNLQKVNVKLSNGTDCGGGHQLLSVDFKDQLCVKPADGQDAGVAYTFGPCTGDRGSPVTCKSNNKWSVVGVVSDELACGLVNQALVANVAHFSEWITKIISLF